MKDLLARFTRALRGPPSKPAAAAGAPTAAPSPAKHAFEPNNELERMLMAAATDPQRRSEFQQLLLRSELFAATPEAAPTGGTRTLEAGENLPLLTVQAPDERSVAALFTSQPRIVETFGPGVGFLRAQGQALLELVASSGAFLNPGSAYRVHWDSAGLASILGRPVTRTITKPTKLLLGTPSEPPGALISQLRDRLGSRPDVPEAWFALAHWPENGERAWYLDVRTKLERTEVAGLLAEVLKGGPFEGLPLDMIVREPGGPDGVGIRIAPALSH
jgi:hypothetical protein